MPPSKRKNIQKKRFENIRKCDVEISVNSGTSKILGPNEKKTCKNSQENDLKVKKSKPNYSQVVQNSKILSNENSDEENNAREPVEFEFAKCSSASHHQGSAIYDERSRGVQCMCMSVVALSLLPGNPKMFNQEMLDTVLHQGDRIYHEVKPGGKKLLLFQEIKDFKFQID